MTPTQELFKEIEEKLREMQKLIAKIKKVLKGKNMYTLMHT